MFRKPIWLFAVGAVLAVGVTPSWTRAEPFWNVLGIKRGVEANANKAYRLTKEEGPWLILARSFSGPDADAKARELVMELRRKHNLPSYAHKIRFDYSGIVRGKHIGKRGGIQRMHYQNGGRKDEIAVLVGNFDSTDSPELQETLKRIKYLRPNCLMKENDDTASRRFAALNNIKRRISGEQKKKGPMGSAFVSRNVLLPKEFYAPGGLDRFVVNMNKGMKYSLLKCRGLYTVRVAMFRGSVVVDQQKIASINRGGNLKARLEQAAEDAHNMTVALRKQGIEAYEFHDRRESYVTVGSFNSVGSTRADGVMQITNPAVRQTIDRFSGKASMNGVVDRKKIAGVYFDVSPIPIRVPRKSVATDYARG